MLRWAVYEAGKTHARAPAPAVGSLAPAGHDPLPGSRVKGARGAAARALRAPRPGRPLAGTSSNQGKGAQ